MLRALALNEAGRRAFPWGIKPGKEHDQPFWAGYFGDSPYPRSRLVSGIWDDALGIGIACPSSQIGLDTDIKNGKLGREQLAELERELGPLPNGPITCTKSGGDHRLFKRMWLPRGAKLRSHVGLSDGTDADIDIIHSGYRYFKVYDDAFWMELRDSEIPEFPEAWLVAVLKGPQGRPRPSARFVASASGTHPPVHSLAHVEATALIDEVRHATGNRNNTLNRNYYRALLTGTDTPSLRESFRQAAADSGLSASEVSDTLDSTQSAAREATSFIASWQVACEEGAASLSPAMRSSLGRVAMVVRQTYLMANDKEAIGLSCRELAETMNVSHSSAARYLRTLVKKRLLIRSGHRQGADANRYRLRIPSMERSETVVHALPKRLSHYFANEVQGDARRARLHQLLQHEAFATTGHGPSLTKSCGEVLVALEEGSRSRRQLDVELGRCSPTIRRSVLILRSAGLVDHDERGLQVWLTGSDATSVLDEWVTAMGLAGRGVLRSEWHSIERQVYAKRVQRLKDLTSWKFKLHSVKVAGT
jgi:predicted transcriptional regulator